jgi:hypothetical protein
MFDEIHDQPNEAARAVFGAVVCLGPLSHGLALANIAVAHRLRPRPS